MGMGNSVLFMGPQKDTSIFYQAMDVFILPSIYEGMPLVGIEAQCAGLPCLITDHVAPEVEVSSHVLFLPVDETNIDKWVEALLTVEKNHCDRNALDPRVRKYDSNIVAKQMAKRYESFWKENK